MINLSWLIFPKVSRVVPAGGRGKDTGRRRRTRRKRGNTRRGQEEGRRRREREALGLRLTPTWTKKIWSLSRVGGSYSFFFFFLIKSFVVSPSTAEKETERIQIIKGPCAWGQGRQPSSTFNLKFRRNLLRVSSRGYQNPPRVTHGPWLDGQEPGQAMLPSTPQAGVHSPLPPCPLLYGEVFLHVQSLSHAMVTC